MTRMHNQLTTRLSFMPFMKFSYISVTNPLLLLLFALTPPMPSMLSRNVNAAKNILSLLTQIHALKDQLSSRINFSFEHVRAHVGNTWNERADVLAKKGAHTPTRIRQVFPRPTSPLSQVPLVVPSIAPDPLTRDLHPTFLVPPTISPPSGLEGLPGHIALFSTQVPITLYHVYEWYTGHRQLLETVK